MRDREISEGDGIDVHVFTLVIINNLKIRFGIESLESKLECFIEEKMVDSHFGLSMYVQDL